MIKFPSARQQSLFMEMNTDSNLLFSIAFIPGRHYISVCRNNLKEQFFYNFLEQKNTL